MQPPLKEKSVLISALHFHLNLYIESRVDLAREEDLPAQQPSTRSYLVVNFSLKITSTRSQLSRSLVCCHDLVPAAEHHPGRGQSK